jgi:hypothetical protein
VSASEMTAIQSQIGENFVVYPRSIFSIKGVRVALVRRSLEKFLFLSRALPDFQGNPWHDGLLCPLTVENALVLMRVCPFLRPQRLPETASFGFGDRLGLATPGHVRALKEAKVFPVLAQQSMRENARTGRNFAQVLADALFGAIQEGYTGGFAADADHLKSLDQAKEAAKLGYTFFTCDPSDFLVPVEKLAPQESKQRIQKSIWDQLKKEYVGPKFVIPGLGELSFGEEELLRIALKYWRALEFAEEMYKTLAKELPEGFDFELSVDETAQPTTAKEHLFLALELRRREIKITSLAPRFPGAMEKAVDYRGDLEEFRRAVKAHATIAQKFGPYRLSLHSGSDKWSLYPIFAKETQGLWHVKTAGTSYLVALRVLARVSPALFREIFLLACERFPLDRQSYHVSADPRSLPKPFELNDADLPKLFEDPAACQVLHVTFGSVLQKFGDDLKKELLAHEEDYHQALAEHLGRHLKALGVKEDV